MTLTVGEASSCACLGDAGYGNTCAHWDAPDEQPWCRVVSVQACGEDDTFESDGHFWSHKPCGGEGRPFDPAAAVRQQPTSAPCCCDWTLLEGRLPLDFLPTATNALGKRCGCGGSGAAAPAHYPQHQPPPPSTDDTAFDRALRAVFGRGGGCYGNTTRAAPIEYGFASMMHSLVKPAWKAMAERRSLEYEPLHVWANPSRCAARDLSCFLQQPGGRAGQCAAVQETGEQSYAWSSSATASWSGAWVRKWRGKPAGAPETPVGMWDDGAARFADVSRTVGFLVRPNARIASLVRAARAAMGWRKGSAGPTIGLHVRTGDMCKDAERNAHGGALPRDCQGLDAYMPHVKKMAALYGATRVVLATDGGEAVTGATSKWPEFTWHFTERPRTKDHKFIEKQIADGEVDAVAEGEAALVDVLLLAQADMFVLKMTSNIDRLVLELAGAKGRCVPPHTSLDAPWCFGFGYPEPFGKPHGSVKRGQFIGQGFLC
jgi:hypothetical protein